MFNPRVTNFKPAPCCVSYKTGNIPSDVQEVMKTIQSHYFNFSVSLIIPDSMTIPANIENVLSLDPYYYKLQSVPLHMFILQDFIDYFIKAGEVTAVCTSDKCLDSDNTLVIAPDGYLVLNIDSKTYQQIGLIKGPAIDVKKNHNNYLIIINLKTACFKVGNKNYDKAFENLSLNSWLKFDILISWEPKDRSICPSSIAKYFTRHSIEVNELNINSSKRISYNVQFPEIKAEEEDLFEWIGAFMFGFHDSIMETGDFEVFETPEPYENMNQVVLASWSGLITRNQIVSLFDELRKLSETMEDAPWIGLNVLGYLDTPICWGFKPHAFRTSGENDYTLVFNNKGSYSMCINTETCSVR